MLDLESLQGLAENAGKLNGRRSSTAPRPGQIPVVGRNGKLPASLGAVGPQGLPGPAGAQGAAGAQGSAGAAGTAGKNGATSVIVRLASRTAAGFNQADVSCATGEVAVGGGGYANGARLLMSQPNQASGTPTGWSAAANEGVTNTTVNAYVICASP